MLLPLNACIDGTLGEISLEWSEGTALCVVLASRGYPGKYERGKEIRGLEELSSEKEVYVFHSGTVRRDGSLVTNGGRVLGVTGMGNSIRKAIDTTYKAPQKLTKVFQRHPLFIHFLNNLLEHKKSGRKHFSHVDFNKFIGTGDWNFRRIYSDITHTSFKSWLFTYENLVNFNGVDILKKINKPVLIIEGKEDTIFNVLVARKIKKLVKRSRLEIIPSANHIIVVNNPEILEREILSFISKLHNFIGKKAR